MKHRKLVEEVRELRREVRRLREAAPLYWPPAPIVVPSLPEIVRRDLTPFPPPWPGYPQPYIGDLPTLAPPSPYQIDTTCGPSLH